MIGNLSIETVMPFILRMSTDEIFGAGWLGESANSTTDPKSHETNNKSPDRQKVKNSEEQRFSSINQPPLTQKIEPHDI